MRITNIQGTNIELTDAIKAYVTQKIEDISRFTKRFDPCDVAVEVGKTSDHHNKGNIFFAELNVAILGDVIRAHSERDDLYAAIDEVKDDVKRQLIEKKEKMVDARAEGAEEIIADEEAEEDEAEGIAVEDEIEE